MNGHSRTSEGPEGQGSSESEDYQHSPYRQPRPQAAQQSRPLYTALNRGLSSDVRPGQTAVQYRPQYQAAPSTLQNQPVYRTPSPAQSGPHRYYSQDQVAPVRHISKLDRTASRESVTLQATNQQHRRAQEEAMSKQGTCAARETPCMIPTHLILFTHTFSPRIQATTFVPPRTTVSFSLCAVGFPARSTMRSKSSSV